MYNYNLRLFLFYYIFLFVFCYTYRELCAVFVCFFFFKKCIKVEFLNNPPEIVVAVGWGWSCFWPSCVVCHLCFGGVCFTGHLEAVGAYRPLVGHRGFNR